MVKKPSSFVDFDSLPASLFNKNSPARQIATDIEDLARHLRYLQAYMFEASKSATTLARAFVVLHKLNENMSLLEKTFTQMFEHYKTVAVPEVLDLAGVSNVPLTEGFRIGTSSRLWASIRADCQSKAFVWLRSAELGDLIKPTVNPQTLSSAIGKHIEEKHEEPPPELINLLWKSNTSVTQTKK